MLRKFAVSAAFAASFVSTGPVMADDLPVVVYGGIYNFPGQQLCQIDRNDQRYRELCWPQSYHPFGPAGYRPMGTYRLYRGAYRFWVMPDAKIVKIGEPERRSELEGPSLNDQDRQGGFNRTGSNEQDRPSGLGRPSYEPEQRNVFDRPMSGEQVR